MRPRWPRCPLSARYRCSVCRIFQQSYKRAVVATDAHAAMTLYWSPTDINGNTDALKETSWTSELLYNNVPTVCREIPLACTTPPLPPPETHFTSIIPHGKNSNAWLCRKVEWKKLFSIYFIVQNVKMGREMQMISRVGAKNKNSCHADPFIAHENP